MRIIPLPFDSSLFNYPVGKVAINEFWEEKVFLEAAQGYQLIYLTSRSPLKLNCTDIKWVDTKVIFEKRLINPSEFPEIIEYTGELTSELEELTYLSGIRSRFRIDTRLKNREFEKLYKIWIIKELQSKSLLTTPKLEGMVTYSAKNNQGSIGLVAVSESYQDQGWGGKLIQAAEWNTYRLGATHLRIPTQETNIPACGLYGSLGYEIVDRAYVYHFWNNSV